MQLDEGADAVQQVVAGAEPAGVVTGGRHGLGERGAGVVGEGAGGVRVHGSGQQPAAQAGDAEPRAFFLGEDGKHHGTFGIKGFFLQQVYGGERGDDAQRPIEAAAVGDRIEVAAGTTA